MIDASRTYERRPALPLEHKTIQEFYVGVYVYDNIPAILPERRNVAGATRREVLANARAQRRGNETLVKITRPDGTSLWNRRGWTVAGKAALAL
jgi:hypothetical protein